MKITFEDIYGNVCMVSNKDALVIEEILELCANGMRGIGFPLGFTDYLEHIKKE